MRISKLTPSKRGQDRWILQLEDGSFLQVGKNQMADFALYDGRELTEEALEDLRRAERPEIQARPHPPAGAGGDPGRGGLRPLGGEPPALVSGGHL